uniref:G2 and S-phase expressed 1 n=1 Tax=Lepisosteus oculatus TaxID=7918 RepID=W5NGP9_LEPOC
MLKMNNSFFLDFVLLTDERFDFDISLSPASGNGDDENDDEVFVGPVCHKEKCVAAGIKVQVKEKENCQMEQSDECANWSPLTGDKFVEIFKEAHLLARQFEKSIDSTHKKELNGGKNEVVEKFVEDSKSKINIFNTPKNAALSPIKRETFCVQDSPLQQLPPVVQRRLLGSNSAKSPSQKTSSGHSPARLCKNQGQKQNLGRKAALSNGHTSRVLPSRPLAPAVSGQNIRGHLAVEKKAVLKHSPTRGCYSGADSSEDLHSNNITTASNVSETSLKSSILEKKNVPVPKKNSCVLRLKENRSTGGEKRNKTSSSSSSSVSSLNSSLSISPLGNGKPNASVNLMNKTKTRISSNVNGQQPPLAGGKLSMSSQLKKSVVLPSKLVKSTSLNKLSTPLKKQHSTNPHQTPAKTNADRLSSLPSMLHSSTQNKTESGVKRSPKLKEFIAPTPTGYIKGPHPSGVSSPENASRIMKPKRLMSCADSFQILNLPAKSVLAMSKLRRSSALPTPVKRRVSGIPAPTPKSATRRSVFSLTSLGSRQYHLLGTYTINFSFYFHTLFSSPLQAKETPQKVNLPSSSEPVKEPYYLSPIPLCSLDFSPEKPVKPDASAKAVSPQTPAQTSVKNCDETSANIAVQSPDIPEDFSKSADKILLIEVDAPPPVRLEDRPLIDLSNTLDLIKLVPIKPAEHGQLIDLSSPLITLSPVARKENKMDSPLIKF